MATLTTVKNQPKSVSFSSAGDNSAIAAVAGMAIYIEELLLTFASPVDVTLKAGSVVLGTYQGITALSLDQMKLGNLFVIPPGSDFIVNLSAGVACKGTVWYSQNRV